MAAVKKSLGWRGVLGICAAVAVSLSATPGLAQRAEPCIGASWEMTGPLANTGASLRIAVETALDQINAAGGVLGKPIRLVIYDDVGEPARAVDNARRIGERDNCVIMMGAGAPPQNPTALREPLAEMGLPWMGVISAGTTVIEHQNGKNEWMFRISMKDRWVTGYLIDQAKRRSASGRIGMVYEGTAWGQGAGADLGAAAEGGGGAVVGEGAREPWRPGHVGADDPAARCRCRYHHSLGGGPREREHAALNGPRRLPAEDRLRLGADHRPCQGRP